MKNDIQKTLDVLKRHPKGIHSFHLNLAVGTTRSAARVNDLKKLGYQIEATPRVKMGDSYGSVYRLVSEPKEKPKDEYTWQYEGNMARQVKVQREPEQLSML